MGEESHAQGYKQMARHHIRQRHAVGTQAGAPADGEDRPRRPIYHKSRTSARNPEHRICLSVTAA